MLMGANTINLMVRNFDPQSFAFVLHRLGCHEYVLVKILNKVETTMHYFRVFHWQSNVHDDSSKRQTKTPEELILIETVLCGPSL